MMLIIKTGVDGIWAFFINCCCCCDTSVDDTDDDDDDEVGDDADIHYPLVEFKNTITFVAFFFPLSIISG